jgi:hypothetical protein
VLFFIQENEAELVGLLLLPCLVPLDKASAFQLKQAASDGLLVVLTIKAKHRGYPTEAWKAVLLIAVAMDFQDHPHSHSHPRDFVSL